jgi:16S rRNA (guanine527-N7)-methyltransferase
METQQLHHAAARLGLTLSEADERCLHAYLGLLLKWNRVYNLTAIRDEGHAWSHHILDCLSVIAPLRRELARMDVGDAEVLDVGAGGGLPGVVIAALCPNIRVTCVDAVGKKAAFIQQTAGALSLPNLRGVHSRIEQLPPSARPRGGFHIITSRAFASLADFVQLTAPWLFHVEQAEPGTAGPAGVWMAMKGKSPDAEIAALPQSTRVRQLEPLSVPGLDEERCIVWLERNSPSP